MSRTINVDLGTPGDVDRCTGERSSRSSRPWGILVVLVALGAAACAGTTETGSPGAGPAGTGTTLAAPPSSPSLSSPAPAAPGTTAPSDTIWLCRPGAADNPCEADRATVVIPGVGPSSVAEVQGSGEPPIDCFYVYPTVSQQPGPNADLTIDPAQISVARAQASPFSEVCQVYAPMYRQLTLSSIGNPAARTEENTALAYADVEAAWLDYLAHHNRGRGVVLIGHSQGTGQLVSLIRRQIDGNAQLRRQLVSALLIGGSVTVPPGEDVGGSFSEVPACRRVDQIGCVVAYNAFLDTPPANSLFGRSRNPDHEVLCTNPAALGGGAAELEPMLPNTTSPQPWATYPELYTGECQNASGAHVLHVTPTPAPGDTRPVVTESLGPTWGLHLVDVNIALGNLVDVVRSQAAAYRP